MVLGIQASCPVRAQATCRFTPVVWCLPEYSSGRLCHDRQGTKGVVDDVLTVRVEVLQLRYPRLEGLGDQGGVDRHHSRDGGLGDRVDVGQQLLGEIVPQYQQNGSGYSGTTLGHGTLPGEGFRNGMCGSVRTGRGSGHGQGVW